jgi:hypothetical protein
MAGSTNNNILLLPSCSSFLPTVVRDSDELFYSLQTSLNCDAQADLHMLDHSLCLLLGETHTRLLFESRVPESIPTESPVTLAHTIVLEFETGTAGTGLVAEQAFLDGRSCIIPPKGSRWRGAKEC